MEQSERTGISVVKAQVPLAEMSADILFVEHDFGKNESMGTDTPVDYLIHFASPTASQYFVSKPVETMITDFYGTQQLLEYAQNCHVT